MTKAPLVLVVDDEASIRQIVRSALEAKGWAVETASTADAALMLAASLHPDAIVLDLGLPDADGKAVVARIRSRDAVPILILSARDQEQEKVRALDAGADDYLAKPFGSDELAARLRALLRRGTPPSEGEVVIGPLVWQAGARRVLLGPSEIKLSPLEYRLFAALASRLDRYVTHGQLLKEVWGLADLSQTHHVRIAVAALRRKLEAATGDASLITTEVGTGYRLNRS